MIKKTFAQTENGPVARVTFSLPCGVWADRIYLVGDFNDWNRTSHLFQQCQDGEWTLTIELRVGGFYQFRYLCDGFWTNDFHADAYVRNPHGSDNFVVSTDPQWRAHTDVENGRGRPVEGKAPAETAGLRPMPVPLRREHSSLLVKMHESKA